MTRRDDSLIGQIVAANVVLVALTLFAASLAAGLDLTDRRPALVVPDPRARDRAHAVREPLDAPAPLRAARAPDQAHREHRPRRARHATSCADSDPVEEIDRLSTSFNRLLERIEEERRRSGTLAMRAQEEERRRLARDLHDEVNQALTAILLRLEALSQDSPPDRVDEVAELKRLVNQAMEELLNLARQLRPTALDDHGLMPAIETQLKRFSARTGIEVRVSNEGEPETLPEDVQTAVYRILQEALANIGRHAGATAVSVEMEVDDERLELRIRDDGAGLRPLLGRPRRQQRRRRRARPQRHGRARAPGGRRARHPLRARRRHHRDAPDRAAREGRLVIRVLIADDHGIVRSGLRMLIDRQSDMEVVAEAEDGVAALESTQQHRPTVAVLDVSMPRMTGLQAAREIRAHAPDTRVVMLSMHDDERYFLEGLEAGAAGYVLKRAADTDLIDAVRTVADGRTFLSDDAQRALMDEWLDGATEVDEPLTPRELEIVKLIAEAYTNKQIAETLKLSEKTVESHRTNVFGKLGMRDRVEIVRYAIRRGLVEP